MTRQAYYAAARTFSQTGEESTLKKTVEVLETSTVFGFYANRNAEPKARG
jgi:hypothetical protein